MIFSKSQIVRNFIKRIIPYRFLKSIRNRKRSTKEIFTKIYNTNQWEGIESLSGPGSEIVQTTSLVQSLNKLLSDLEINSILDLPCGDFHWMKNINLSDIEYVGADIVKELIIKNKKRHKEKKNIRFQVINLIEDPLPECDILICRDCLVHFSFEDITYAINNIKSSGCKYLLTTTFTNYQSNYDIETGGWRRLNLQEKPFSFPPPLILINENCTEGNGKYRDKSMALWEIKNL